jgi:ribonuclease BN (tRNA processing enzyme)
VHPDHTGDLVPFLFAQRTTPGFERTEPLRIFGPRGFRAFFDRVREVYGRWIESDQYPLLVGELWGEGAGAGDITFETFRMRHSVACVGYRFTGAGGETVAYTGDTDATTEVARLAADVDVLIADCSAPDEAKMEGHLTPGEVGRLAAQGGARQVVLSHLYPHCESVDLVRQCRRQFGGEIHLAHDLMVLEIAGGTVTVGTLAPQVWPEGWSHGG